MDHFSQDPAAPCIFNFEQAKIKYERPIVKNWERIQTDWVGEPAKCCAGGLQSLIFFFFFFFPTLASTHPPEEPFAGVIVACDGIC